MEFIESSAKTIEEATKKGLAKLEEMGKSFERSEIIESPSNGFLGFGKKDAIVRMYYSEPISIFDDIMAAEEEEAKATETEVEEVVVEETPVATEEVVVEEEIAPSTDAKPAEEEVKPEEPVVEEAQAPVLTAEKQAEIADRAKEFLQGVFENMGLDCVMEKMSTYERVTFQVHGENLGFVIGKHGQTLEAIQYLTNLVANKGEQARCHIMVDIGGYRERRERTLEQLAGRLAAKVRRNRHKISLEPMNAYERKIIHSALQDMPHIGTHSEGEGPSRHIVITYVK